MPNFNKIIKASFSAGETWTATEDCYVLGAMKYDPSQGQYDTTLLFGSKIIASCYGGGTNGFTVYSPVSILLKKGAAIRTGTKGDYSMVFVCGF